MTHYTVNCSKFFNVNFQILTLQLPISLSPDFYHPVSALSILFSQGGSCIQVGCSSELLPLFRNCQMRSQNTIIHDPYFFLLYPMYQGITSSMTPLRAEHRQHLFTILFIYLYSYVNRENGTQGSCLDAMNYKLPTLLITKS